MPPQDRSSEPLSQELERQLPFLPVVELRVHACPAAPLLATAVDGENDIRIDDREQGSLVSGDPFT